MGSSGRACEKNTYLGPSGRPCGKKLIWALRPTPRKNTYSAAGPARPAKKILPRSLRRPISSFQNPYKMKRNGHLRHLPRKIITWPSPAANKYLFGSLRPALRKNTYLSPSGRPCEKILIWPLRPALRKKIFGRWGQPGLRKKNTSSAPQTAHIPPPKPL